MKPTTNNSIIWITNKTKFKIVNEKILSKKMSTKEKEVETGYIKINWKADEISKDMATIHIENKSNVPSYGGIYWQYFEDLENMKFFRLILLCLFSK